GVRRARRHHRGAGVSDRAPHSPTRVGEQTVTNEVKYEKRDQIAFVTLNRPDKGNSLTRQMEGAFREIWADVKRDPDVRATIITAAGERHFCTGFDVSSAEPGGSVAEDKPLKEAVPW